MNEVVRHRTFDHVSDQLNKSRNNLGIKKINRVYDKGRDQLIFMICTREMLNPELSACIKRNRLHLEVPIQLNYNKPYRTKLKGGNLQHESEIDLSLIGFSEIKLKPGYHYSVISCQLINPTLIKTILKCKPSFIHTSHVKFNKNKLRK